MLDLLVSLLVSAGTAVAPAALTGPQPSVVADTKASGSATPEPRGKPAPAQPPVPVSPLRRLMQAQLDSASRDEATDGLTAAEADAVMAHYLASIGKPIAAGQTGQHP